MDYIDGLVSTFPEENAHATAHTTWHDSIKNKSNPLKTGSPWTSLDQNTDRRPESLPLTTIQAGNLTHWGSEWMAQSPKGGLYGSPSKRHLRVCAIYSETTVTGDRNGWMSKIVDDHGGPVTPTCPTRGEKLCWDPLTAQPEKLLP